MPRETGGANKKKLSDYSAINNNTKKMTGRDREREGEREVKTDYD